MNHREVARLTARRYAPAGEVEDMEQEAMYALWREEQRRGELSDREAFLVAKSRVLRVIEQRPLGSERPVGRPPGGNGVKPVKEVLTLEGVVYDDRLHVVPDHAGEVALKVDVERALDELNPPERMVVECLYWGDMTWREAKTWLGFTPQAYWKTAKAKLQLALEGVA